MTESAYTKGPWVVVRSKAQHDGAYDYAISAPDTLVLAEAFGRDAKGGFAPADANARLIAAAPDLVEALEEMVRWYGKRGGDADELLPADQQQPETAKAMAALSRALGNVDAALKMVGGTGFEPVTPSV